MGDGYRRWAEILAKAEVADVAKAMLDTYDKDGIDLYVPLMIDYEYWFKNSPEPSISKQIEKIYEDVVVPSEGRIHPFVPFCPAREVAHRRGLPGPDHPDNGPIETSSLALVKDAIENKGFIGVKLYNSLGYRPLGNVKVDEKRRKILRRNRRDRYTVFTGEEIDEVLCDLYQFCVDEQVPITTHCGYTGVEAYSGASLHFGHPKFWRKVLNRYPDLHLNLAHFGWAPGGYFPPERNIVMRSLKSLSRALSDGEEPVTWVRTICEMLEKYDNLFTDVAHHNVMAEDAVPEFQRSYRAMCSDFPDLLQCRLMFGIDWHVITRADGFENFMERYVEVLDEEEIFSIADVGEFLGGNAVRFLGLGPEGDAGWSGNHERLRRFYDSQGIEPPEWFKAAAREATSEAELSHDESRVLVPTGAS
jgi:predicted TIM-barrel fold metal-dependent hydrolase